MLGISRRREMDYQTGIYNLLLPLIGGIPIAMPTDPSVTMAIGSHRLSQQGAITKRITAIEEMAGIDAICSDKAGTLTVIFTTSVNKDTVVLMAATTSRHVLESQKFTSSHSIQQTKGHL